MKKFTRILLLLSFLLPGYVNAQTGIRFGLKAGYSLATQYGITPAEDIYIRLIPKAEMALPEGYSYIFQYLNQ